MTNEYHFADAAAATDTKASALDPAGSMRVQQIKELAEEKYQRAFAAGCLIGAVEIHLFLNAVSRNDSAAAAKWAGEFAGTEENYGYSWPKGDAA